MDLFEYQAKELLSRYGAAVPDGKIATTPEQASAVAAELGGPVVVKAQVKIGGRGKAGGIKLAMEPDEARDRARQILGMHIRGHTVHTVLVERASDIAEELYFSFLLDRGSRTFLAVASREGGMEIEEVAATKPEAVVKVPIDPLSGVDPQKAREIADAVGSPETAVATKVAELIEKLWQVFTGEDATLVEVNPMILTTDGRVVALDAKVSLDDNAGFRHDRTLFADPRSLDPFEARARERGLNYVKLDDGQVGIIGNGAGLVMSTLDVVAYEGRMREVRPANFLDIGGGASAQVMADGLEVVLSDPEVRCVFVNVFGGITACDEVANGIVQALALLSDRGEEIDRPLVVRLDGNNRDAGRRVLMDASHPLVEQVDTMDGAAQRAAQRAVRGR